MYAGAIEHFEKRIVPMTRLEWALLPHSSKEGDQARTEESTAILARIKPDDIVVLFDERGNNFTSESLAGTIEQAQNQSKDLVFIIGGAYGVNDELRVRADHILAFGTSVFPHQLMRVMVLEQLYRAYGILAGSKYHHA